MIEAVSDRSFVYFSEEFLHIHVNTRPKKFKMYIRYLTIYKIVPGDLILLAKFVAI